MSDMYHYQQCGLSGVWLVNGYVIEETPYGQGIRITDIDELHKVIGRALVDKPQNLAGEEIRFLRRELDLSQHRLGEILGVSGQSVANWEKENTDNPTADYLIRHIYKETVLRDSQGYVEMVEELTRRDRDEYDGFQFKSTEEGWKKAV